jgi:hypothetical protein
LLSILSSATLHLPAPHLLALHLPSASMGKLNTGDGNSEKIAGMVDSSVHDINESYKMGEVIGEGRFSKVYAGVGKDVKNVALKEIDIALLEEDEEALDMFEAEVLALRKATGTQHVVSLYDVIAASDAVFLAMQRVPGRELFELVDERGPLPGSMVCPHRRAQRRPSCSRRDARPSPSPFPHILTHIQCRRASLMQPCR